VDKYFLNKTFIFLSFLVNSAEDLTLFGASHVPTVSEKKKKEWREAVVKRLLWINYPHKTLLFFHKGVVYCGHKIPAIWLW